MTDLVIPPSYDPYKRLKRDVYRATFEAWDASTIEALILRLTDAPPAQQVFVEVDRWYNRTGRPRVAMGAYECARLCKAWEAYSDVR